MIRDSDLADPDDEVHDQQTAALNSSPETSPANT